MEKRGFLFLPKVEYFTEINDESDILYPFCVLWSRANSEYRLFFKTAIGVEGLFLSLTFRYPYCNSDLDIDTRLDDLMSRLSLEECASLLNSESPAIPHLGMK